MDFLFIIVFSLQNDLVIECITCWYYGA